MDTDAAPSSELPPAFGHATHVGLVRDHNEDCYRAEPALGLWVIADGMGGHASGDIASALVVDHIVRKIEEGAALSEAVATAHAAVLASSAQGKGRPGMGSTAAALLLKDDEYSVAWVGDSRAYLWNGEDLVQITRDHSLVQYLVDNGAITESEAQGHKDRNILTQAIGLLGRDAIDVDETRGRLYRGDQILLCSDGLHGEVSKERLVAVLRGASSEQNAVERLIEQALDNGGSDNVTVLLVSAPPDAPVRSNVHDAASGNGDELASNAMVSRKRRLGIAAIIGGALVAACLAWLLAT